MVYQKIKEYLKYYLKEILRTKKTPNSIALGFAIGTFIGILPTPGFNILTGLLIVFLFKRISKYSLFLAIAFWNPITAIPLYYLSFRLSRIIFEINDSLTLNLFSLTSIKAISMKFLLTNLIIAFFISLISYFVIYYLVKKIQEKKLIKKLKEKRLKKINSYFPTFG
jgi:uncharacterized protein